VTTNFRPHHKSKVKSTRTETSFTLPPSSFPQSTPAHLKKKSKKLTAQLVRCAATKTTTRESELEKVIFLGPAAKEEKNGGIEHPVVG
jgi:hypothetical protein